MGRGKDLVVGTTEILTGAGAIAASGYAMYASAEQCKRSDAILKEDQSKGISQFSDPRYGDPTARCVAGTILDGQLGIPTAAYAGGALIIDGSRRIVRAISMPLGNSSRDIEMGSQNPSNSRQNARER